MRSTRTITFISYEREPTLASDVFEFLVPTGTIEDEGPQLGGDDPIVEAGVYRIGPRVSGPTITYKVEPSYTDEARQARVSGMVLVSPAVGADGNPRNMGVVRFP